MCTLKKNITKDINTLQATPGQILKAAREDSGIGIGEVSQALLLSKSIINALEADDYSNIVAKVYAEGYIKSYAAFLRLPVMELLENFRRLDIYRENKIKPIEGKSNNDTEKLSELFDLLRNYLSKSQQFISELFELLKNKITSYEQLKYKKPVVFLIIFASILGLVSIIVVHKKYTLVKTPKESAVSSNSTAATSIFPITINTGLASASPEINIPENNKKIKKIKKGRKVKPEVKVNLLDENPEDLNDDVAN